MDHLSLIGLILNETLMLSEGQYFEEKMLDIYHEGRGFYGSPRIHRKLVMKGYNCSKKRVERLMKGS